MNEITKNNERAAALGLTLRGLFEANGGIQRVAARSGVPASSLYTWRDGRVLPSIVALEAIAEACGVDIAEILSTGGAPPTPRAAPKASSLTIIPWLNVRASAGPGAINGAINGNTLDDAPGALAVGPDFLRRHGLSAGRVHAISAVGDSMEPTIRDGDLLLVDRSAGRVVDDGIYIMSLGEAVVVKRVQARRDGSLVLISDNPRYAPEVVPPSEIGSLRINGRVRWSGRGI